MDSLQYLKKHSTQQPLIPHSPLQDLGMIVTIPAFEENETIHQSIQSLINASATGSAVEILVLINYPDNISKSKKESTREFTESLRDWSAGQSTKNKAIFILEKSLPEKNAGVGLARKIIMDEAIRRFSMIGKEGIIICFDADCTCDENYLKAIEDYFEENKTSPGCSIYFEHNISESPDSKAILDYELYLRYYIQGLKFAKYPFAFHTVGSAMAVRTENYKRQGGMNQRKAAEDFYFLHKIIPTGGFGNLTSTTVRPSGRISRRVPFGTGKAMEKWNKENLTYWPAFDPQTFILIREFLAIRNRIFKEEINPEWMEENLDSIIKRFLLNEDLIQKVKEMKSGTTNLVTFEKAFFRWFNGLKVLKMSNFVRDQYLNAIPVVDAAMKLLQIQNQNFNGTDEDLLEYYRKLDRLN